MVDELLDRVQPAGRRQRPDGLRARAAGARHVAGRARPRPSRQLQESVPITAFFGPYSPDLQGTLREFGQTTAYYDANGHYARISPVFPDFALDAKNNLTPASAAQALAPLKTGQLRTLPGRGDAAGGGRLLAVHRLGTAQLRPDTAPMNRRRNTSLAGSPLLIGAVTTLIVVVAVFLSYNANNGLPFVPTYNIKVVLPEGSGLQPSNQVRIAGTRVGIVGSLTPHQDPSTGRVTAIANLHLEKKVEPLPGDTKAIVLSVSAIGLKYLELEKGKSSETIKAGHEIPVSQTTEPVDIDQLFNMFDEKTRTAIQVNTNNFGDGLAGRGLEINEALAHAQAAGHQRDPGTPQPRVAADRPARPVQRPRPARRRDGAGGRAERGVVHRAGHLLHGLRERRKIAGRSDRGRPCLAGTGDLLAAPRGGVHGKEHRVHAPAAPERGNADDGRQAARRRVRGGRGQPREATALNTQLAASSQALQKFAENPIVTAEPRRLHADAAVRQPGARGAGARAGVLQLPDADLPQRGEPAVGEHRRRHARARRPGARAERPNNEGFPSSAPANGPSIEKAFVGSSTIVDNNHVHANPYPNVAGPGQPRVCEAANETYEKGKAVLGNLPAASVATQREVTSREENLFGQKYSAEQLKNLGISTASEEDGEEEDASKGKKK